MSNLFGEQPVGVVVPVSSVIELTGVTPDALSLHDRNDPDKALEAMLEAWIAETASNVRVRLGRQVDPDGPEAPGIRGVIVRTVANIIGVAMQQRSSPVIQLSDFAVNVLNTSEALAKLDAELAPFKDYDPNDGDGGGTGGSFDLFWSSQPYEPKG